MFLISFVFSFALLTSSFWKFLSFLWHFVATGSLSVTPNLKNSKLFHHRLRACTMPQRYLPPWFFLHKPGSSALSNQQSPVLTTSLDDGYSVFQYIVDMVGIFKQYIDMKKHISMTALEYSHVLNWDVPEYWFHQYRDYHVAEISASFKSRGVAMTLVLNLNSKNQFQMKFKHILPQNENIRYWGTRNTNASRVQP